jgi:GT2 family glycosyltransferase
MENLVDPSIDVIIINWNAGDQLMACLQSLASTNRQCMSLARVVVVDNASRDASLDCVEHLSPSLPMITIRNSENRGFGAGCNQGAAGSTADYLLFLNPDVRLLPESLSAPIRFLEEPHHDAIGICGVQLLDEHGCVARTCARFPSARLLLPRTLGLDRFFPSVFPDHAMTEWDHQESRQVDQVMGAFFLVRRSLFESLGGFDERFFVYFEEVDFSYRARLAGWSSFYLAEAHAFHKGGGASEQVKATRLFYSLRSRITYGYKHFSPPAALAVALATLIVEPVARLALAASHRSKREAIETLRGYGRLWAAAPRLLRSGGQS